MGPILTCLDLADRLLDFLFRLLAQLAKVFQNPLQYFLVCFTGMELHRFESLLGFLAELNCCGGHGDGHRGSGSYRSLYCTIVSDTSLEVDRVGFEPTAS